MKSVKETDRRTSEVPGSSRSAPEHVKQVSAMGPAPGSVGTGNPHRPTPTADSHADGNYLGTRMSIYTFASNVLGRARQRVGAELGLIPPVVDALATQVRGDISLKSLVQSVALLKASKSEKQRFHDAADKAANMARSQSAVPRNNLPRLGHTGSALDVKNSTHDNGHMAERSSGKATATRDEQSTADDTAGLRSNKGSRSDDTITDVSALQILAMRARITLKQSKLASPDPLINKIVTKASLDSGFARVLDHVAGAAGNIAPNAEQLRMFKGYIASATKLLETEATQKSDHVKPVTEKLSSEQWPLRVSSHHARRGNSRSDKYYPHPHCGFTGYPYFHEVAYPLSLLPKATWEALHNTRLEDAECSYCRRSCKISPHQHKLFLVGERLSWPVGTFGVKAQSKNEEALWAVNYGLGIEEPVMLSSQETFLGGKKSGKDPWFPYQTQVEADLAMMVIEKADVLTEASWEAWKRSAA